MDKKTELEMLQMLENIPIPPNKPFLLTSSDCKTVKVSRELISYFNKINIKVKETENKDLILRLCEENNVDYFNIDITVIDKNGLPIENLDNNN